MHSVSLSLLDAWRGRGSGCSAIGAPGLPCEPAHSDISNQAPPQSNSAPINASDAGSALGGVARKESESERDAGLKARGAGQIGGRGADNRQQTAVLLADELSTKERRRPSC